MLVEVMRCAVGKAEPCVSLRPIGPADKIDNGKPSLRMKKRYEGIKDATDVHSRNRLRRARKNEALPQLACQAGRVLNVGDFIGGPNRPCLCLPADDKSNLPVPLPHEQAAFVLGSVISCLSLITS